MRKNEEGEFELVVGNRQLLSVLFVMFVLFGVVFSMGYFIGRSTAPEPGPAVAEARQAPAESPAPSRPEPSQPAAEPPATTQTAPGEAKVAPQPTVPVGSTKPESPAAVPVPDAKPIPAPPPPQPPSKPPAVERPAEPGEPALGQTYLQVAAVGKPEAELVVDVLKKRGFSALVAPVPGGTRWRALVGPVKDSAALAKVRADLQAAGFKEVIVRKY